MRNTSFPADERLHSSRVLTGFMGQFKYNSVYSPEAQARAKAQADATRRSLLEFFPLTLGTIPDHLAQCNFAPIGIDAPTKASKAPKVPFKMTWFRCSAELMAQIKAKAVAEGLSLSKYVLRLVEIDTADVVVPANGQCPVTMPTKGASRSGLSKRSKL